LLLINKFISGKVILIYTKVMEVKDCTINVKVGKKGKNVASICSPFDGY